MWDLKRVSKIIVAGFFMGVAMILPGLSWPAMAVIIGVYEPLMIVLGKLLTNPRGLQREEWHLLLFLGTGILISLMTISRFISVIFSAFGFQLQSLFIGLIFGSAYILYYEVKRRGPTEILWFLIGIAVVITPTLIGYGPERIQEIIPRNGQIFLDFISGVAASTFLPAIGDTIMLLLLGNYHHLIEAIENFRVFTIAVFASGFAAGSFFFIRIISGLLKRHKYQMFSFIVGMMIASIVPLWPFRILRYSPARLSAFLLLIACGVGISVYLSKKSVEGS